MAETGRPILDPNEILDRVGGDTAFFEEIACLFLDDCPKLLSDIRSAVKSRDAGALWHAAHTLKGSVANFGAEPAREAAFRLEILGRTGKLEEAPAACAALEQEMHQFTQALASLARQVNAK